ncbi:MAG: hypothetical protein O7H41_20250 [Planctomycetota bacterium]|nr:hypothetical protein [Planctomycetota bacterium]
MRAPVHPKNPVSLGQQVLATTLNCCPDGYFQGMILLQSPSRAGRAGVVLPLRLGRYLIIFLFGICQPKLVLMAKVLALQSQLVACKDRIDRKKLPRPRFVPAFRILWVVLSELIDG